jgi:hypothetical protein
MEQAVVKSAVFMVPGEQGEEHIVVVWVTHTNLVIERLFHLRENGIRLVMEAEVGHSSRGARPDLSKSPCLRDEPRRVRGAVKSCFVLNRYWNVTEPARLGPRTAPKFALFV